MSIRKNPLQVYFWEIGQTRLLTQAEEVQLFKEYESGKLAARELKNQIEIPQRLGKVLSFRKQVKEGKKAKQTIIRANLRLVVYVAKRYRDSPLDFADLIQEGNLGLIRAVEKFDYRLGYKFSTYATHWIRQKIGRAIANQANPIRVPVYVLEKIRKLKRIRQLLLQEYNREPTKEEIAVEFGEFTDDETVEIKQKIASEQGRLRDGIAEHLAELVEEVDKLWEYAKLSYPPKSIYSYIDSDTIFSDTLEDDKFNSEFDSMLDKIIHEEFCTRMQELLTSLSPRLKEVISLRYGLLDGKDYAIEEVADELGITETYAYQVERKAIRHLRKRVRHIILYL